ncbi:MAG: YicC/YloC family endoribonuclease, partial [Sedimentisphaerales bacterium]
MINSMTGYGQAEGEVNGINYAVEIKTVNNRYLKTNIKLPEAVAFLEEDIEKLLRKNLSRGTISYVLRLKQVSANALFDIDETALRAIMDRLTRLTSSADVKVTIDMSSLLNLPGIIRPTLPDKEMAEQIKDAVLNITKEAVEKLKQMRAAEGNFLEADLKNHHQAIRQDLERIRARSTAIVQEYARRLKKRVNELLAEAKLKLDEETLAREVAILADKSDISEEIARLDAHLAQFAESWQANSPQPGAGRRLDFITQEMLREANTIASKASDAEIIHYVVDIKCQIERIKEQVQ